MRTVSGFFSVLFELEKTVGTLSKLNSYQKENYIGFF